MRSSFPLHGNGTAMRRCILLLSLLLLVVLLTAVTTADAQDAGTSDGDQVALIAFFQALDGANWVRRDGWNSTFTSHCNWYGVLCDANSRVQSIVLRDNSVGGAPALVDLTALDQLQTVYLDDNALSGIVPFSWLKLPKLEVLFLDNNAFTNFPDVSFADVLATTSLKNLTLADNRFWCPIPTYIDSVTFSIDITSKSCIRTKSETIVYTPTLLLEPPVPTSDIFDVSRTLDRLYVRTSQNVSNEEVITNFSKTFHNVLEINAKDDEDVTALPKAFEITVVQWKSTSWMLVDFTDFLSVTTNTQRIDLALRIKFGHASVEGLQIVDFSWLYQGDDLHTDPPALTEAPIESVAANKEARMLLILGVSIFALLLVVLIAAYFCRRQSYIQPKPVPQPVPLTQPPQPGTMMQPPPEQQQQQQQPQQYPQQQQGQQYPQQQKQQPGQGQQQQYNDQPAQDPQQQGQGQPQVLPQLNLSPERLQQQQSVAELL